MYKVANCMPIIAQARKPWGYIRAIFYVLFKLGWYQSELNCYKEYVNCNL